jgi:diguanylate cyclase
VQARAPKRRTAWGRALLWSGYGLLAGYLAGYLLCLITQPADQPWPPFGAWWVDGASLAGAALCLLRSLRRKRYGKGRAIALTLGVALLMGALGSLVFTLERAGGTPSTPSMADACWLAFFPAAYVALVLFVRGEVRHVPAPSWLDGAVAGTGAAAVCSAFAFHSISTFSGPTALATATNLAYPIGELLLLCLVVGGAAVLSDRISTAWLLLVAGVIVNVAGKTAGLFDAHLGRAGFVLSAMTWPASILLLSMAMWIRPRPADPFAEPKPATFVIPGISTLAAFIVLYVGNLHHTNRIAFLLATATLLLVGLRLVTSVRALRSLSHERRHQSLTDELTGLGNRRCLSLVLDVFFTELERLDESGGPARSLAFLFIDLDRFKEINDTFGHPAGDQLLRQVGPRLTSCLRESDLLVRLGGDEFVVLLLDAGAAEATRVAERLNDALSEPFELGGLTASLSGSIGIAVAPGDATSGAQLLQCADTAMYRAKHGGIPFAVHQAELDKNGNRLQLLEELHTALAKGQLLLHYQPQLDLRTGDIVAVESLLRWAHPELGLLLPLDFLAFAEEAGLMWPITRFVLREAIAQCARWRAEGSSLTMSVNISATNLGDPQLKYLVRELLDIYGVAPQALVLEITETSVIADYEVAARVIQELRDLGVVVSVDDFGAGFTSLAHLSSLAVKELKLDRAFITGLTDEGRTSDLNLVRATIELGHAMGLRIVAEGIEDVATLHLLADLGCDVGQGFYIGKPKPADRLGLRGPHSPANQPAHLPAAAPAHYIPQQPTGPRETAEQHPH